MTTPAPAQSKRMSLVEALASTAIGYVVALATQAVVYPLFSIEATASEHVTIAGIFTVVSVVRGYAVRRMFNRISESDA